MRHLRDGGYFGDDGRIVQLHDRFRAGLEELAARRPDRLRGPWGIGAMIGFSRSPAATIEKFKPLRAELLRAVRNPFKDAK